MATENETTDGTEGLQRKRELPGLLEGSRRTCFCCILFKRRVFGGLKTEDNCVSTISFPTLSTANCTAIRHKPQQRFKTRISSGCRPAFFFPPAGRRISIPDLCVNVRAMFKWFYIWSLLWIFSFLWVWEGGDGESSETGMTLERAEGQRIYERTGHIHLISTTYSVLTLTCKCMETLNKTKKKKREMKTNKYLIFLLKKKKLPLV